MKNLPIKADGALIRDGIINSYINEIGKPQYEPLSSGEEKVVLSLFLKGDTSARDILIKRNLRYVIYVAKVYQNTWYSLSDLISAGNVGLINGVDAIPRLFDVEKYTRLINYLSWRVQGTIVAFLNENLWHIRLPQQVINMKKKIEAFQEKFLKENTWEASAEVIAEEIADNTKFSYSEAINFLQHSNVIVGSGETKKGKANADTLIEGEESYENIIPCDDTEYSADNEVMQESFQSDVQRALAVLYPREREIIEAYFGLGGEGLMTIEEVGDKYDLTRERVRQIKERAIKRLQVSKYSINLKKYLG